MWPRKQPTEGATKDKQEVPCTQSKFQGETRINTLDYSYRNLSRYARRMRSVRDDNPRTALGLVIGKSLSEEVKLRSLEVKWRTKIHPRHTCGGQPEGCRPKGPNARVQTFFLDALVSEQRLQLLHLTLMAENIKTCLIP